MFKKILAATSAVALAIGLVALVASPASAHTYSTSADCAAGVSVKLTNYASPKTVNGVTKTNHVTVTEDGSVVADTDFGTSLVKTYAWATSAAQHNWRVVVTAYDDAKYSFDTGTKSTECVSAVVAAVVTSTNPICQSAGTVGGGGYTIPAAQTGVTYQLQNNTTGAWAPIGTGVYPASPGAVIHVRAVPSSSLYTLSGTTAWNFTLSNPDASLCIVPAPPTPSPAACVVGAPGQSTGATFSVPTQADVRYEVQNGTTWTTVTGTVPVTTFPATVVIRAVALGSHTFPASAVTQWTFTFASAGSCVVTVTPVVPTPQQSVCDGPGSSTTNGYTIIPTTGVSYEVQSGATWVPATNGFTSVGSGATSVTIRAIAAANYAFPNGQQTTWTLTFTDAGACLTPTAVGNPTFVDVVCDAQHPGQTALGSYQLVSGEHVTFAVSVNGGTATPIVVGTKYSANPGDTVVITATPDTGYTIAPALDSTKFTYTFSSPSSCLVSTSVQPPVPADQSCDITDLQLDGTGTSVLVPASITIPAATGVQFSINGSPVASGTSYPLAPGQYSVTVAALTGYVIDPPVTQPWVLTLASAEACGDLDTHPLVDPVVTHTDLTCTGGGSYTLSNDLSDAAAITWTVNGSVVSQGPYTVSTAGIVTIHAEANGPTYGFAAGTTQDWTLDFEQPTTCELKTLALTGSSPTGWIALGYLLLVSGLALVALRFVRRRREQS